MYRMLSLLFALSVSSLVAEEAFSPFAGKVTGDRVRIRLEPHLDSPILRESDSNELFVVVDETNEFYAIQPPSDVKAFVFRTYVLDGAVEGSNVNVRLEPSLDASIIGQLNTGDSIKAVASETDSKWLELATPDSLRFYIAKEYVENAGRQELVKEQEKRNREASHILSSAYLLSQSELDKPFTEINFETLTAGFNKIIEDYSELSHEVESAEEARTLVQDAYLEKKIAFLEAKAQQSSKTWEANQTDLNEVVRSYQEKLAAMEQQLFESESPSESKELASSENTYIAVEQGGIWHPLEKSEYRKWLRSNHQRTMEDFYKEEHVASTTLSGLLQPYNQPVKNKPGEYILVNSLDNIPIAYLYSTKVDLHEQIGREVTVQGSPRPNNHFAFPAYHVLSVE